MTKPLGTSKAAAVSPTSNAGALPEAARESRSATGKFNRNGRSGGPDLGEGEEDQVDGGDLGVGVAQVVATYLPSLRMLRAYDAREIASVPGVTPTWTLGYDQARAVIDEVAAEFPEDTLFGGERGDSLRGIVETIYQGFGGVELYPTVQSKAANLLYLLVKDHPMIDGNKRSAAALFVYFLARNEILEDSRGVPRVSNNALVAITLMVALSDPKDKEVMIALLVSMLAEDPT